MPESCCDVLYKNIEDFFILSGHNHYVFSLFTIGFRKSDLFPAFQTHANFLILFSKCSVFIVFLLNFFHFFAAFRFSFFVFRFAFRYLLPAPIVSSFFTNSRK